eukprot:TRINITY_DN7293_c0_g1_i6.p1 TRINITY_DN7293_c0_g1~~TRINITY_DN7293_c0_g1_i6.p1  ORF type:complete len:196 (+),score=39.84 TRINITY_DN7293_c0_g1_i6:107-694(+)
MSEEGIKGKIQIITLGDHTVGKSSILKRFNDGSFSLSTQTTIGLDFVFKDVKVGNTSVPTKLWDTAGQDRFHNITQSFYKKCHGVLLVFDVESRKSFVNVKKWLVNMQSHAEADINKYLVGNKIDTDQREVKKEEAEKMAAEYKMKYFETSAKNNVNITETITSLVSDIYTRLNGQFKETGIKLNGTVKKRGSCC